MTDDRKKPAAANTTSPSGARPDAAKKSEEAAKGDPMGQPPGPSPAPNPESAPGGDKVE